MSTIPPGVLEGAILGKPLGPKPDSGGSPGWVSTWGQGKQPPNLKQQDAIARERLRAKLPVVGAGLPWADFSADAALRARIRSLIESGTWPEFAVETQRSVNNRPMIWFVRTAV